MNVATIPIAWAFLQIALLCTFSLMWAWLWRGRRPQWNSALLAGTCIASLALAVVSIVPNWQWTLAIQELSPPIHETPTLVIESSRSSLPAHETIVEVHDSSNADVGIAESGRNGERGFDSVRKLLSQYLLRVDHEVRQAEVWQQPVAKARNVSVVVFVIFGLGFMMVLWCSSWLYMRRILRFSIRVEDEEVLRSVADHSRSFGLSRVPAVRESSQVPIGATVGWWRVTVLLHPEWRTWTAQERTAVIAHELAHAVRRDFVWVIISSWTRILLFFHPMIHMLIHRLRLEQELAADQLAADKVGNAKAYGRALASLALRSQHSLDASNPKLSSMLAAGQICVTRRVKMLRQGSLQSLKKRSRWTLCAMLGIVCSAIPLAGLRGTTQEPDQTVGAGDKTGTEEPTSGAPSESQAPSKEFLAAYPPLEFKGAMTYRPGRFRAGEFGPEAAWIQEWFMISAFGRPLPDQGTVHGQCIGTGRWTDETRSHGMIGFSTSFTESDVTTPGLLTSLANLPTIGGLRPLRIVETHSVRGRQLSGVTNAPTGDQPEKWLIDDEQGYFLGSREDAEKYIEGQSIAIKNIPDRFVTDYQNAAFAVVFTDCISWHDKLEAHAKGSPREAEFQAGVSVIKGVKELGVFVDGCRSPACSMRAVMEDARSAKRLSTQAKALVELGKLALQSEASSSEEKVVLEVQQSILETMSIVENENEVVFQFDVFVPALKNGSAFGKVCELAGWMDFNGKSEMTESPGVVEIQATNGMESSPGLVGQTLDATEYRGKVIAIELELQCQDEFAKQVGAFAWASKYEPVAGPTNAGRKPGQSGSPYVGHRVLQARTAAAEGSSRYDIEVHANQRPESQPSVADSPWRKVQVQVAVPADATLVSFGCYSKRANARIRNIRFDVGNQLAELGQDASALIPFSPLVMPGYDIRKEPTNLDFAVRSEETVMQGTQPESTQRR
jgi:beta-lactamase regulating signal transducer with metallopeptidase domain